MNWKVKLIILMTSILFLNGCGYKNHDECLLGEMKHQLESMRYTADKVCERKFPFEKAIYPELDGKFSIDWSSQGNNVLIIKIKLNESDYRITRARVEFSKIPCELSNPSDYDTNLMAKFNSAGISEINTLEVNQYKCMRTRVVYGVLSNT